MDLHTKSIEIRDIGTFIPAIAILMTSDLEETKYLLRRSGYGLNNPLVLLCRMDANGGKSQASYDVYGWDNNTMKSAHFWIERHWNEFESGDVIDIEYISGITSSPKLSERLSHP